MNLFHLNLIYGQKIQNLKVVINQNILTQLFNYIQIPNLKNYELNINGLSKMNKEEINLNKDEFNSINMLLNEILKNKIMMKFRNNYKLFNNKLLYYNKII